ncbi:MAG: DUF5706 domain-containing protein [Deltaproteobacteria bacterium]|jgi:hypothetical protein|nr:DUF5706 domain-containing protein [Deltaproteobacteria bacterium]
MMNMREDLRFICSTVDACLRYAESKHAYLVAFNGVAIFGGFGVLRNLSASSSGYIQAMLVITMLLLIAAIITSLYSFLPKIVQTVGVRPPARGDNALFFEHIKEYTVDSYASLLCDKYRARLEDILPLDRCIIAQTIINAHLASRKFAIFRLVVLFDMIAVVLGLGGFILGTLFSS